MKMEKDMRPEINTVLQDTIFKKEYMDFKDAYSKAKEKNDLKEMKRLYNLAISLTSRNSNNNAINPYFEDFFDKAEYDRIKTEYKLAKKSGNEEKLQKIKEELFRLSGRDPSSHNINPYIRKYFDDKEAKNYIDEKNRAQKNGDKKNYQRITNIMKQAAGNIEFVEFRYTPNKEEKENSGNERED